MTSRRDFLKKAGLLSAAFAVPALNVNGDTPQSKIRLKNTKIAVDDRWDVIVIGGGPGGCTAAISAAREGAKTLLIEAMGQLGGMGTAGMVPAWCPFSDGEKIIYRGLAGKRQQSWIFCKIRIELCSGMRYNDKKGCGPLRPVFQPVRCIYDDIYSAL